MLNPNLNLKLNRSVCQRVTGVTLIEMIMTLAVIAIVLALGTPATARWVRQSELRSSAETLRSVLQRTRAEAVSRNARMRVSLGDAQGRPGWAMGCVRVNTGCPAQLVLHAADAQSKVRWGAAKIAVAGNLSVALAAGAALPGSIDFYPFGDAPQVADGTDITRIDLFHVADANVRRLIVSIDGGGNVRICDPTLAATDPGAC